MNRVKSVNVAAYLLSLADKDGIGLSPLKLIKLVYMCEGWSLALRGKPLIRESIEAWQYGPVIAELYSKIRHFRASPVSLSGDEDDILSTDQQELVNSVYRAYNHLSGMQLSDLTHQAGTPWSQIWDKHNRKQIIPRDMITDHFTALAAA